MSPLVDLTPLPGTLTTTADAKLDTVDERAAARNTYITASGKGVGRYRSYILSNVDGDKIQLKGGTTGASFFGFIFWSKATLVPVGLLALPFLANHINRSKALAMAFARLDTATAEEYAEREKVYNEAVADLEKNATLIRETDVISLKPGETFTAVNRENMFAENYFTERHGFIQWTMGFEIRETQYNEAYNGNADFGQEIEDRTEVKNLATLVYKFFQPTTPPPEDFEIAEEEAGGTAITTGEPLVDGLAGLGADLRNLAAPLASILLMIGAMFILFMFRAPIQAVGTATGNLVSEAITR